MSWQKELAIEAVIVLILAIVASVWFGKSFFGLVLGWIWMMGWVLVLGIVITVALFVAIQWSLAHKRKQNQE